MMRVLQNIPRHVLISIAVLATTLVLLAILLPVLGGALDDAFAENRRIQEAIGKTKNDFTRIDADARFVQENQQKFEDLLQNGRLIPHTRRAAVVVLNDLAKEHGLTAMEYSFAAVSAGSNPVTPLQAGNKAYRLSVEEIELKLGAPTDGPIYRFIDAIEKSLPGSAVLQSVEVKRAPTVTNSALELLSQGKDPKLAEAVVRLAWRTAQAQEEVAVK